MKTHSQSNDSLSDLLQMQSDFLSDYIMVNSDQLWSDFIKNAKLTEQFLPL